MLRCHCGDWAVAEDIVEEDTSKAALWCCCCSLHQGVCELRDGHVHGESYGHLSCALCVSVSLHMCLYVAESL